MTQRLPLSGLALEFFTWFGGLAALLGETFGYILRGAISYRHTVRQMADVGVGSLLVAIITVGFSGAVAALYVAIQLVKYGQQGFVGGLVGKSLFLEIAPVITAVVVAARAGSAMAAELGSMVVTEQVDALRSLAVPPVRYLVVPRVLGTLIMLPLVTILAAGAGVMGGYYASVTNGVSPSAYWESLKNIIELSDIVKGLLKTIPFALLISLIGCRQGLTTKGGAQGVGRATTSAVVFALIAIFVSDFFLSLLLQDAAGFVS
ncbi:MAG TPA: ABC transporter permease [Abditibacteriaceae bacterium]|jgi:phospholipid/cholesterol/gamma-HCH transport system permease protein